MNRLLIKRLFLRHPEIKTAFLYLIAGTIGISSFWLCQITGWHWSAAAFLTGVSGFMAKEAEAIIDNALTPNRFK
jgi:hypothetical protein